jgi:putative photosynthetic complex assembly protein 2
MSELAAPMAYAVLVWWITTGMILFLNGLPRSTFVWSVAGASAVLLAAGYELHLSAGDASVNGAYAAFTCAILVWGWLEMTFLMGLITGPRKHACIERCAGWRHFVHAAQAIIYNEVATAFGALCIALATLQKPNRVALWTYLILWVMRLSAKLNLFLGVPNLGEKFLPPHLEYLKSFFRKRSMNFLFPFSITGCTLAIALLAYEYATAVDAFETTSIALLASLLALATLEHWFMVLPLPSEKLWSWALKATREPRGQDNLERRVTAKVP